MSEQLVCAATALYSVVWNNPRIHPPEREKIWVASTRPSRLTAGILGGYDNPRDTNDRGMGNLQHTRMPRSHSTRAHTLSRLRPAGSRSARPCSAAWP
jgi:hypothetical protein